MLVLNAAPTQFNEMWTCFPKPEARWPKHNSLEINESLYYYSQVLHLESATVEVFRVVRWAFAHPCPPSTFSVCISHPHTLAYSQSQQATGPSLSLDGSHEGSAGRALRRSQGWPLWRAFFKYVFGVTEIPTTCTPPYFSYALVLASSGKKNAPCGLAHLGLAASACSPLRSAEGVDSKTRTISPYSAAHSWNFSFFICFSKSFLWHENLPVLILLW